LDGAGLFSLAQTHTSGAEARIFSADFM